MRLPNADQAIIPAEKLRDYVFSKEHSKGRHKEAVFASLGYHQREWFHLEGDLRTQHTQQHLSLDAEPVGETNSAGSS